MRDVEDENSHTRLDPPWLDAYWAPEQVLSSEGTPGQLHKG